MAKQIDAVISGYSSRCGKIGMLSGREVMETVAERLAFYRAEHIVLDPVMVATSGSSLLRMEQRRCWKL